MSYGVDLAILAQCNHTVLDYGTFGLWAALFAGGRIILPGENMKIFASKCKKYSAFSELLPEANTRPRVVDHGWDGQCRVY